MQSNHFESCFRKRGIKFGFWHRRYCKLTDSQLIIYKTEMPLKIKYSLDITPHTTIEIVESEKVAQIKLTFPEKNPIFLSHDDVDTMLTWFAQIRNMIRRAPNISMDNFNILSVIGRGFFGKVMLCENKDTHELFAIKTIHKNRLIRANKVKTIFTERNVLFRVHHPFIVQIKFSFQTDTKVYLGLEYVAGGELFSHLRKDGHLPMDEIRLYVAEVAIALQYLHSLGIVYRDLKPENILLDSQGHIKLTDFGLARNIDGYMKHLSICGTSEYMSPEALSHKQYGPEVDWWALGILTFELIFGRTPFYDENKPKLYEKIRTQEVEFPTDIEYDKNGRSLINALLTKDPKNRIRFNELKVHPFFKGMCFGSIERKEVLPLYTPPVKSDRSVDNFGAEFTNEQAIDSMATPPRIGKDAFAGFSFCEEDVMSQYSESNN